MSVAETSCDHLPYNFGNEHQKLHNYLCDRANEMSPDNPGDAWRTLAAAILAELGWLIADFTRLPDSSPDVALKERTEFLDERIEELRQCVEASALYLTEIPDQEH